MNTKVLALTLFAAVASFVPAAQAGVLCEDEDGDVTVCLKRIPYLNYIPKSIPEVSKVVPKSVERKVEKKVDDESDVGAKRPAPRAADADIKIVEKPAAVRVPDIARICKKYFPNLGEMLPIPCDD
jgi:hypothetical protein